MLASLASMSVLGSASRSNASIETNNDNTNRNASNNNVLDSTSVDSLELIDIRVPGSARLGRRANVYVPKTSNADGSSQFPMLVLLHGLGETGSERDGVFAWANRYGLLTSYRRLQRPPVSTGVTSTRYLKADRADEIDRQLASHPFKGFVLVCPYTPNVFSMPTNQAIDDYSAWIVDVLIPEVRSRTPTRDDVRWTGIDGVSLGGFVSYRVFQRRPEAFFTCGGVQAAIGKAAAPEHAQRFDDVIKRVGPRRLHIETSTQDPYHDANVALSRMLTSRGVEHQLRVAPGPHNQPWLIEVGALEMLLWHDRQLAIPPSAAPAPAPGI
ncbi:MAG: hypothetical protein FWD57_02690 [Polyangiaceae bacterium]|nr:hypothetical protein [Polyangiaceae bacterium]